MTSRPSSHWLRLLLLGGLLAGVAVAVGFVAGDRFGDAVQRRWHALVAEPAIDESGWTVMAESDLPRYEFLRVPLGDSVLLMSGFGTKDVIAHRRVEVLNLRTGAWSPRRDMPIGLTHTTPVRMGDTVWIVGGFEGDHPGPTTRRVWRYSLSTDEWTEGPSLPEVRGSGGTAALGDTLHYFGGYVADRDSNAGDHWVLAPGDSVWRPRAPLPTPRGHISSVSLDGYLYALSGSVGHDPLPLDVTIAQRYDARSDQWTAVRSAPQSLSHSEPSTLVYAGGILSTGGRAREIGVENRQDVLWYSPATDRWRYIGRPPEPMLGGLAVVAHDTLYYGLGAARGNDAETHEIWKRALRNRWDRLDSMPLAIGEVAGGVIGDSLYLVGQGSRLTLIYDLSVGQWLPDFRLPARPAAGNHHAAEVINGKLYLFGGIAVKAEGTVQVYDPAVRRWTFGALMPYPGGSVASGVIDGLVYVAGGISNGRTTAEAAVYDPETDRWRGIAPMPRPRNHAASASDGTRLYVFGGRGPGSGDSNVVANGFDDVQIYDPATDQWIVSDGTPDAPRPLPRARGGTGKAVHLNGEFWIIGGETLTGEGANALGTYGRVDIYDPRSNTWREGPALQVPRHGIFPLLDHGWILVAGGGVRAGRGESRVVESIWPK